MNDLRLDSRGKIISRGDFALCIHRTEDNDLLMTSGFYEGEHTNPNPNDFNLCPTRSIKLSTKDGPSVKNAFVFRLDSIHEVMMFHDLLQIAAKVAAEYEKTGKIRNPKRLYTKLTEILGRDDRAAPFDAVSEDFDDNIDEFLKESGDEE